MNLSYPFYDGIVSDNYKPNGKDSISILCYIKQSFEHDIFNWKKKTDLRTFLKYLWIEIKPISPT